MIPVNSAGNVVKDRSTRIAWLSPCRPAERVVIAFFTYAALLGLIREPAILLHWYSLLVPVALWTMAWAAEQKGGAAAGYARDWLLPLAVLAGYWRMGWFRTSPDPAWQQTFLAWDRWLLDTAGLRWWIESGVPGLASWLELSYLLLYAVPPVCIGVLYWKGMRSRVDRFLAAFALGALTVYALLPYLAVESPRTAFQGLDAPAAGGIWRTANVWILDRLDIATSVFPSGHVAVAFSCALGLRAALPREPLYGRLALATAFSVFLATIHGRYHYAADGVASILICLLTARILDALDPVR